MTPENDQNTLFSIGICRRHFDDRFVNKDLISIIPCVSQEEEEG